MYWIYLLLFVLIVFVPDLVRGGLFFLSEERVEELALFALGSLAFILYLFKEKQLGLKLREKNKIQREASLATQDLKDTYSYIGEINRKIEILKDIALKLNDQDKVASLRENELMKSIIHAIKTFTRSRKVTMRFFQAKNGQVMKEFKDSGKAPCKIIPASELLDNKFGLVEKDGYFFLWAPKPVDGVNVCIAIEKRNTNQKLDDPELIKALAAQALFLFNLVLKKEEKEKSPSR